MRERGGRLDVTLSGCVPVCARREAEEKAARAVAALESRSAAPQPAPVVVEDRKAAKEAEELRSKARAFAPYGALAG